MGEYIPSAPINDEAKKNNKNLPGMGGVFNHINLSLYHYAGNNPIRYVDPTGMWTLSIGVFGSAGAGVGGSVSAGITIGFSFEKGLTVGVWTSESIGAEFSVDAAAGIIVGLDPFASSVETGNSQTMTIGGSADLGFSIGADYTLDIDSKSSNVTFFGTSGKSATNGKYAIKIGVGASATAVEGHARYNLTQTKAVNVGDKLAELEDFIENTDFAKSASTKLKDFETNFINEIIGY